MGRNLILRRIILKGLATDTIDMILSRSQIHGPIVPCLETQSKNITCLKGQTNKKICRNAPSVYKLEF